MLPGKQPKIPFRFRQLQLSCNRRLWNLGIYSLNTINLDVNLDPTTIQLFGEALGNDVELSWNILNAPPSGELIHYEIYRNSALLAKA